MSVSRFCRKRGCFALSQQLQFRQSFFLSKKQNKNNHDNKKLEIKTWKTTKLKMSQFLGFWAAF
jgi:hypothetical protein